VTAAERARRFHELRQARIDRWAAAEKARAARQHPSAGQQAEWQRLADPQSDERRALADALMAEFDNMFGGTDE